MRKSGKKIKTVAVLPNGVKRGQVWEMPIHAALLALDNGKITQAHFDDLNTLAEMTRRTTTEKHLLTHANAIRRVLSPIGQRGGVCTLSEAISIKISAGMLLDHVFALPNAVVAKTSLDAMREAA